MCLNSLTLPRKIILGFYLNKNRRIDHLFPRIIIQFAQTARKFLDLFLSLGSNNNYNLLLIKKSLKSKTSRCVDRTQILLLIDTLGSYVRCPIK